MSIRRAVSGSLSDCVVIDCETTGLDPATDHIIEIAALRVRRGQPVAVFHRLVAPGRPLPRIITSLTGLTDGDLRDAPPVDAVLDELTSFMDDGTVVGHNVGFDLAFIDAAIRTAHAVPRRASASLCTADTARALIPRHQVGRYRLSTLAEALDLEHRPNHRTVGDVLATLDLLRHLARLAAEDGAG